MGQNLIERLYYNKCSKYDQNIISGIARMARWRQGRHPAESVPFFEIYHIYSGRNFPEPKKFYSAWMSSLPVDFLSL
ncbi:hypothetical protein TNCV_1364541 [Trichonephila clavipes]|nr:hypothetical protein TNCV_1364541 [Trichonephila clavipes]